MIEVSVEILSILFLTAVIAGWVDAIAGGGGLITIPALLLTGIPPAAAIATNKLPGCFGTMTAAIYFIKQQAVSWRGNILPICTACIGSIIGGFVLTQIEAAYLNYLVPVLLILIAIYFIFFAKNLDECKKPRVSHLQFSTAIAPALGFYDGFFGPGAGSVMTTSLITMRGFPIRNATAHARFFNFVSNISALVYFLFFGQIFWLIGAIMIMGQVLGSYLGARVALKAGAKLIRPMIIIVCLVMSTRILWTLVGSAGGNAL